MCIEKPLRVKMNVFANIDMIICYYDTVSTDPVFCFHCSSILIIFSLNCKNKNEQYSNESESQEI